MKPIRSAILWILSLLLLLGINAVIAWDDWLIRRRLRRLHP